MSSPSTVSGDMVCVSQNRHSLLKLPKEVMFQIHFYASQSNERTGKHNEPSRLSETCRDLRWLRRYGKTQSLKLTSRDAPVPESIKAGVRFKKLVPCKELEDFDPTEDPLSFRQELIYLTVFLDRHEPQGEQVSWRALNPLLHPSRYDHLRMQGELANFNLRLSKLLRDACNLRYLSLDIDFECNGIPFSHLFTHPQTHLTNWNGDLQAAGGLQTLLRNSQKEFWKTWKPQCLEHLHIAADDHVTASIISQCRPGILKHLHIHHSNVSFSFAAAAFLRGPFITRLSLTLEHGGSDQHAPYGLETLSSWVLEDIGDHFPNLEWLALFHCKGPHRSAHGFNSIWPAASLESIDEIVELDETCEILANELEAMPKLRKIALALSDRVSGPPVEIAGYIIDDDFVEEDMFPLYKRCAKIILREAPHIDLVSIISKRPTAYLFTREQDNTNDSDDESEPDEFAPVTPLKVMSERVDEDEPKNGFLGFPFTLRSEPWEQTYARDDEGHRKDFRHPVMDRDN